MEYQTCCLKIYVLHLKKNILKKNTNYLIIKFDELKNCPENIFKRIINFYQIKFDLEKINKAIKINSKRIYFKKS